LLHFLGVGGQYNQVTEGTYFFEVPALPTNASAKIEVNLMDASLADSISDMRIRFYQKKQY
jgi:uncharacterized lipoprotein YbaY